MSPPLLIARLCGGLGNQLFIYAAAAALARARQARLMLDDALSFKSDAYRRRYRLGAFQGPAACPKLPAPFRGIAGRALRRLLMSLPARTPGLPYYSEPPGCAFDPSLSTRPLPPVLYLEGYWQNEAYFRASAPALREQLKAVRPPDPESARLAGDWNPETTVSLHVRRNWNPPGARPDSCPGTVTLGEDYYRNAIQTVRQAIPNSRFAVFGDDRAWAQATLPLPPERTDWIPDGREDVDDLLLMARCRHHIIANSSFSWWGAWLGETASSLILAPGAGFANRRTVPARWKVL